LPHVWADLKELLQLTMIKVCDFMVRKSHTQSGVVKKIDFKKKKESLRWVRLETHLFELHRFQEMVQDAFETIQVSDQQVLFHLVILKMIIQLVIG
jgi:hypothetical protein